MGLTDNGVAIGPSALVRLAERRRAARANGELHVPFDGAQGKKAARACRTPNCGERCLRRCLCRGCYYPCNPCYPWLETSLSRPLQVRDLRPTRESADRREFGGDASAGGVWTCLRQAGERGNAGEPLSSEIITPARGSCPDREKATSSRPLFGEASADAAERVRSFSGKDIVARI